MSDLVVGFLFAPDNKSVVLIHKLRPAWQEGLLNGIGGHVAANESCLDAMVREFREETGLFIGSGFWRQLATLRFDDVVLHAYFAQSAHASHAKTQFVADGLPAEEIEIVRVSQLSRLDLIPNLHWLLPLALDPRHPISGKIFWRG